MCATVLAAALGLCNAPSVYAQAKDSGANKSGLSRQCTTQDVLRGQCTAEEASQNAASKPFRVMGQFALQVPVVVDPSPENDTTLSYYLGAEVDLPVSGLYGTAWVGVIQRFWRFQGQAQSDLEDPFVGIGHRSSIALSDTRSLVMVHRGSLFFPLSRPSRKNLYYTMLDWVSVFRLPIGGGLLAGLDLRAQYRFHRYAEQVSDFITVDDIAPDPSAANTRVNLLARTLLQQKVFDSATFGNLIAQGTAGYRHQLRYDGSGVPGWSWSLGLIYTPVAFVSVAAAMEHGSSALNRNGLIRAVAFDRDETFWSMSVFGRY